MRLAAFVATLVVAGSVRAAPPLTQQLTANDRLKGDEFGWAAAIDADVAVISARGRRIGDGQYAGVAVALRRVGGAWTVTQVIDEADSEESFRQFGHRIALAGGLMAIGAPGFNDGGGGVYLYHSVAGTWVRDMIVDDPQPTVDTRLGVAVAIDGTTALVGATNEALPPMPNDSSIGRVRVFEYGETWAETGFLLAIDSEAGNRFGFSTAIAGDVAVVGAPGKDSARGTAYVFVRSAGKWQQTAKLAASDRMPGDFFGTSVAALGDAVIVGAYAVLGGTGAAYVFERKGEAWTQTQVLTAPTPMVGEAYGIRVALSGAYALVSGYGYDTQMGFGPRGGGYLYGRLAGGYTLLTPLRPDDGVPGDYLGVGAGLSGGVAVLGAPYDDANTQPVYDISSALGSAYVFRLNQGLGEACTADEDCSGGAACCDEVCAPACEGEPTSTGDVGTSAGDETSSSGAGEASGGSPPSPSLEPLSPGCGCSAGGPGSAALWVPVFLRTRRRRR